MNCTHMKVYISSEAFQHPAQSINEGSDVYLYSALTTEQCCFLVFIISNKCNDVGDNKHYTWCSVH